MTLAEATDPRQGGSPGVRAAGLNTCQIMVSQVYHRHHSLSI
jgi:hypothetical protein